MNYTKIYENLVKRGQTRKLDGYSEVHHITPKFMGGSDLKQNLTILTPEEHYLAHKLLAMIHNGFINITKHNIDKVFKSPEPELNMIIFRMTTTKNADYDDMKLTQKEVDFMNQKNGNKKYGRMRRILYDKTCSGKLYKGKKKKSQSDDSKQWMIDYPEASKIIRSLQYNFKSIITDTTKVCAVCEKAVEFSGYFDNRCIFCKKCHIKAKFKGQLKKKFMILIDKLSAVDATSSTSFRLD